jgi:hypothetical protein
MDAYLALNLESNRDLLPQVAERFGADTRAIEGGLRRAQYLYAGLRGQPTGGQRVHAVAVGRFPSTGLGFALTESRGWRRVRGQPSWFANVGTGLEVAILEPGVALISNGGMADSLPLAAADGPPSLEGPRLTLAQLAGMGDDLVLFLPTLPPELGALSGPASAAIRELWVQVRRLAKDPSSADSAILLEIDLGFRLSGEREAALFRPVLRLLLAGMARQGRLPGGTSALAGVRDESAGNVVRLAGIRVDLAGLLTLAEQLAPQGLGGPVE